MLEHFYPYIGGAEKLFWELARELVAAGHEVGVVTTRFRSDLPKEETLGGIQIYRLDCRSRFLFSFLSLPLVWRTLRGYDLVHTTSYNAAFPAWIAARLRGKPVVVTFHEVWGRLWWRLPFANALQRLAFFAWEAMLLRLPFTRFVGVSEFSKQELIRHGVAPKRVLRIYNGLDYAAFESVPRAELPDKFTFTYFGRLGMSKGLDLLLPAAGRLARDLPDVRFNLVVPREPASMFAWLQDQIDQEELADRVQLHHNLPKDSLLALVRNSHAVLIPSYSEGFCFVAAEAVALGAPIVSSHRGALPEVVSGRFVRMERMDAEALTEAMRAAYTGNWEQTAPRVFPLHDSVAQYIELYKATTKRMN